MKHKKYNTYCCDFETTPYNQYLEEGKTRVYLWCLMNVDETFSKYGIDLPSFFSLLTELKEDNILIYFHNLTFDGEFILWYLLENGFISTTLGENILRAETVPLYILSVINYEFLR